jgi:signal transduction histidine kinase
VFRSIRWRLVASYALLILLAVTLMGAIALTLLGTYVDRQERAFLSDNARSVVGQAVVFLQAPVRRVALQELAYTSAFLGNARVRIMDPEGTVIADSGDPAQPDEFIWLAPSGLAEIDAERRGASPFIITLPPQTRGEDGKNLKDLLPFIRDLPLGTSRIFAHRFFTPWGRRFEFETEGKPSETAAAIPSRTFISVTQPVEAEGVRLGIVELSSPLSLQREAIGTMRTSLLLSGLGALAVAVAFGLIFGKTLTDPLRSLAFTAKRMAGGDLTARAPENRRDEMGAVAGQFNAMAENLEKSFSDLRSERDALKRFVADASHELRTPITALSTFTELLQGSASDDPKARAEFLEESRVQLARLEWITANLLNLSRLDAGIASLEFAEHDAEGILEETASQYRARAREKGIEIAVTPPASPLRVFLDRARVIMALGNLAANAIKFTPAGGRVEIGAEQNGNSARFLVRDTGEGIDAGDLEKIFERFFRGKNATSEGAGLGLAIVKSVAEAHGGSVSVRSEAGKGSLFTVDIPMRGAPGA